MMFGLYLIQGMFYGYVYSLPLAYRDIPNYSILGLFAASGLPFSFKFILGNMICIQLPLLNIISLLVTVKERPGSILQY